MTRTICKSARAPLLAAALCVLLTACALEPKPLDGEARAERAAQDLATLHDISYTPSAPITLEEAMARAIAFNLQRRVKEIETEIEDAELRTKNIDMLPTLEGDLEWDRNTQQLSSTDDRVVKSANVSLTWNILDLGVSYARARRQADEVLVARERQRKALQDIIKQVRIAYWRAVGAERLMGRVRTVAESMKVAIRESRNLEATGANDIAKSVAYRREIIESVRQALDVQRELHEAKAELAELLNIQPGSDFELASVRLASAMPTLPLTLEEMEVHALDNRPELRIEDYNERMSVWQPREALFDMLPGLKLSAGRNYSSDQFNLAPNWLNTGFQLGLNLFDLFSGTSEIDEADKRGELARRQRLALTLAVMTQTHIAYVQYRSSAQQMRLARELARADRRIAHLVSTDTDFVNTDYFEAVRLVTRQLQSEMDEHAARIQMVAAHTDVMHAIGLDVVPEDAEIGNFEGLKNEIIRITARWKSEREEPLAPPETPLDLLVEAMLPKKTPGAKDDDDRAIRIRLPDGLAPGAGPEGPDPVAPPPRTIQTAAADAPRSASDGNDTPAGSDTALDPDQSIPEIALPAGTTAPAEIHPASVSGVVTASAPLTLPH